MTEQVEASGPTVEDAIDAALEQLGATEDEVEVRILSEGDDDDPLMKSGARVLVRFRDERTDEDHAVAREAQAVEKERRRRVDPEVAARQTEAVRDFLEGLVQVMGIDIEIQAAPSAYGTAVRLHGEDVALLIGKHGATLDSLRELCRAVAQMHSSIRANVDLDIEGYLQRRTELLERVAHRMASKARRTGKPVALEPMPPRDRKIVHDALTDFGGVRTASEGQEPNRYVVILPA